MKTPSSTKENFTDRATEVGQFMIYTHLGVTPFVWVVAINIAMFTTMMARMIPSQALTSAIPAADSRGAFMAVSSSIQQVSGGIAAVIAGAIVTQTESGHIEHFDRIGFVICGTTAATMVLMVLVSKIVAKQMSRSSQTL